MAVLSSFLAAPLIVLFRNCPNLREGVSITAACCKFFIVLCILPLVSSGLVVEYSLLELLPNVDLAFRVDALGVLFALVASSLWIITTVYSIGYMRSLNEHGQTRFFAFFAIALSCTIGAAFAANLLTLFLFYELLSFSTYPLVTHHQDAAARSAGRKYLTFIVGSSIGLVLPAMIYCYSVAGTLDFSPMGILSGKVPSWAAALLLLAFTFGFAKAALMPVHVWLPGAMVAPTPVSALLHAVAVVKVGVFSILRVVTGVFGVDYLREVLLGGLRVHLVVAIIAAVTVVLSSLIALSQDDLKRRLAFSTIGQLGYIVLGAMLLTPRAFAGGALHIAMHAFGKITLFFCAGAIFLAAGKKCISELAGLGRRMPLTFTAFLLGSLSVIGMPPAGGFISKVHLLLGAAQGELLPFLICYLLSSLLAASYLLPIVFKAFFAKSAAAEDLGNICEAPAACLVPLTLTALFSVMLFFFPNPFADLCEAAARTFFGV
jgi:multicomponent Na+:H+ antiporter subunit D